MGQYGQFQIDDYIACIIRDEARKANIPEFIPMGIAGAESSWDPTSHNTAGEDSVGLFQLNRAGGQGTGYSVEELLNPRRNAQIAMPPIANAYFACSNAGWRGTDLIRCVAANSGHPGNVDWHDYRIDRIVDITLRLIFNPDGTYASWPEFNPAVCADVPPPPPPIDSWSEGPAPANRDEADAAISRHAERIGELVDRW